VGYSCRTAGDPHLPWCSERESGSACPSALSPRDSVIFSHRLNGHPNPYERRRKTDKAEEITGDRETEQIDAGRHLDHGCYRVENESLYAHQSPCSFAAARILRS